MPPTFSLALVACDAEDGRSAVISNLTNGVIVIRSDQTSPAVTYTPGSTDSLGYALTSSVATLGADGIGGYRLGPKSSVTAAADVEGGPQLVVEFDASLSVAGFAASYVANYFEGLGQTPGQQLLDAGAACVEGVTNTAGNLTGRPEDLTNGLLDSISCAGLYKLLTQYGDEASEAAASAALVQTAERSAPAWNDLFSMLGRAISIVR